MLECRQSRLLRFDQQGYQLYTVDHNDNGRLRLDLQHAWAATDSPEPVTPEHELIPDESAGWLRSQLDCGVTQSYQEAAGPVQWLVGGPNVLLAVQQGMVVEYDLQMRAPVGVVAFLEEGGTLALLFDYYCKAAAMLSAVLPQTLYARGFLQWLCGCGMCCSSICISKSICLHTSHWKWLLSLAMSNKLPVQYIRVSADILTPVCCFRCRSPSVPYYCRRRQASSRGWLRCSSSSAVQCSLPRVYAAGAKR